LDSLRFEHLDQRPPAGQVAGDVSGRGRAGRMTRAGLMTEQGQAIIDLAKATG
jgi:hypothetical protein